MLLMNRSALLANVRLELVSQTQVTPASEQAAIHGLESCSRPPPIWSGCGRCPTMIVESSEAVIPAELGSTGCVVELAFGETNCEKEGGGISGSWRLWVSSEVSLVPSCATGTTESLVAFEDIESGFLPQEMDESSSDRTSDLCSTLGR